MPEMEMCFPSCPPVADFRLTKLIRIHQSNPDRVRALTPNSTLDFTQNNYE